MSSPSIQLAPDARHDLRDRDAQRDAPVTAAEMIAELDATIRAYDYGAGGLYPRHNTALDRRLAALRAIREVIVEIAPGVCPACGELNPIWLQGDGTRVPCWSCRTTRHLTQPHSAGPEIPLPATVSGATLPADAALVLPAGAAPIDRASAPPPADRDTGGGGL